MYTRRDYDRYASMLKKMGIEDPVLVDKTLEFLYRTAVIAVESYNARTTDQNEQEEGQDKS